MAETGSELTKVPFRKCSLILFVRKVSTSVFRLALNTMLIRNIYQSSGWKRVNEYYKDSARSNQKVSVVSFFTNVSDQSPMALCNWAVT